MSLIQSTIQCEQKCLEHSKPLEYLCIEKYCSSTSKLLCKSCIKEHQHHLIVNSLQSIKMCKEYIIQKNQIEQDLIQLVNNINNLKYNIIKCIESMELQFKDGLQQMKLRQSVEKSIEKYLSNRDKTNLGELEFNFIASYLSQISTKEKKEVRLNNEFQNLYDKAVYLEQLFNNVQEKLQIINPEINLQKLDSKIQVHQFNKLSKNEVFCLKNDQIAITQIKPLISCKVIGFMQPMINGIDQYQEQILIFSIHDSINLDEYLYQQEIKINHQSMQIINDCYLIKINPIILIKNNIYYFSLKTKQKIHLNQFIRQSLENPYLLFSQIQSDICKIQNSEIIVQHGQFPTLIIETQKDK